MAAPRLPFDDLQTLLELRPAAPLPRRRPEGGTQNPPLTGRKRKREMPSSRESLYPGLLDQDVKTHAALIERQFRDPVAAVASRQLLRENLTLRQFYEEWMLPEQRQRVKAGDLARSTLKKYRQALTRWEQYTLPPGWPASRPWPGLPIGSITGLYLDSVLLDMRATLAVDTVKSTWNHLRTILNYADRVQVLEKAPQRKRQKRIKREPRTYTREEIETAYGALEDFVDLQVAFVVGCNCGLRTIDLFLLRWDAFEDLDGPRAAVKVTAFKTDKEQKLPLAPITVQHLRRLPSYRKDEYVFPVRSNPRAIEPEDSKPAERRRAIVRSLFVSAGLDIEKPFQVARATCNTRLNSTPGFDRAGNFMLGHDLGCNSTSYMNPSELVYQAVRAVEQPACFLVF